MRNNGPQTPKLLTLMFVICISLCACSTKPVEDVGIAAGVFDGTDAPVQGMVDTLEGSAGDEGPTPDTSDSADDSGLTPDTTDFVDAGSDYTACFASVPIYGGEPYAVVNNNVPFIDGFDAAIPLGAYEYYSELDDLGRPQKAYACLCTETMPADGEERGEIGMIKPAGWHTVKYPDVIEGLYLYNRCHLIGWQLGAENANELNLMTGTRYLNVTGMLPFENQVADYIHETGNHVYYRITPDYVDDELIARGLLMEAKSVEDDDCVFCVYCYNVQPGIVIDYATGDSWLDDGYVVASEPATTEPTAEPTETVTPEPDAATAATESATCTYVCNTNTMKCHKSDCRYVDDIKDKNRLDIDATPAELQSLGYEPCKVCNPW